MRCLMLSLAAVLFAAPAVQAQDAGARARASSASSRGHQAAAPQTARAAAPARGHDATAKAKLHSKEWSPEQVARRKAWVAKAKAAKAGKLQMKAHAGSRRARIANAKSHSVQLSQAIRRRAAAGKLSPQAQKKLQAVLKKRAQAHGGNGRKAAAAQAFKAKVQRRMSQAKLRSIQMSKAKARGSRAQRR